MRRIKIINVCTLLLSDDTKHSNLDNVQIEIKNNEEIPVKLFIPLGIPFGVFSKIIFKITGLFIQSTQFKEYTIYTTILTPDIEVNNDLIENNVNMQLTELDMMEYKSLISLHVKNIQKVSPNLSQFTIIAFNLYSVMKDNINLVNIPLLFNINPVSDDINRIFCQSSVIDNNSCSSNPIEYVKTSNKNLNIFKSIDDRYNTCGFYFGKTIETNQNTVLVLQHINISQCCMITFTFSIISIESYEVITDKLLTWVEKNLQIMMNKVHLNVALQIPIDLNNNSFIITKGRGIWVVETNIKQNLSEITKIFTSPKSLHVKEVVKAANEGGSSLNILSGFVAGNFSAFWTGLVFVFLMFTAYLFSLSDALTSLGMNYVPIFAFGLVAFGMLGMGPVTIAVDSYGPVTDNAQSVYELSLIEEEKDIDEKIEKDFGFKPDWEKAKYYLEANDGAGNTFKATAKPVLIGTAVVGATTMIFSLILMIEKTLGIAPGNLLNLLNPYTILGFILGGCVIYWFTGASTQAVTTGAYRAVEYIKKNINLDTNAPKKADEKSSIEVVSICTHYAQKGMFNIFIAIFFFALGIACLSSPSSIGGENAVSLFISYLVSIALFGLFQAVFLANAGGSWDNAKKIVEVDMKAKGTPLHDASVVGDTVGDPFKDTSSVALNPIIKFTTLFGLFAMEIAISEAFRNIAPYIGIVFFIIACYFVYRSFYKMRIDQ